MKKIITLIFLVMLSGCVGLQSPEKAGLAVGQLLEQVQIAINEISKNTENSSLPAFNKAEITLLTQYDQSSIAGATIFLSAKGEKSSKENNLLTLTLKANPSSVPKVNAEVGQKIAEYVLAAVRAVDKQKALKLVKLNVEVGLEISESIEGGIEVDIIGVSIEGTKTKSSTSGHKLTLLFED